MEDMFPFCQTRQVNAVLEPGAPDDDGSVSVKLFNRQGLTQVVTWVPVEVAFDDRVTKATVEYLEIETDHAPLRIATRVTMRDDIEVFTLIPFSKGHDELIVDRFCAVVEAIERAPLRWFLSEVFTLRRIYGGFWTATASANHHHAYVGGLADHSIEMAEQVREHGEIPARDREIGIVYALLHDIGKLWDGPFPRREHELTGVTELAPLFRRFAMDWADGAFALRSLMSGLWKCQGKRRVMAIGKLVQALDQMSVERDLRNGANPSREPWQPQDWQGDVSDQPF